MPEKLSTAAAEIGLALEALESGCSVTELRLLSGRPKAMVMDALCELEGRGFIARKPDDTWHSRKKLFFGVGVLPEGSAVSELGFALYRFVHGTDLEGGALLLEIAQARIAEGYPGRAVLILDLVLRRLKDCSLKDASPDMLREFVEMGLKVQGMTLCISMHVETARDITPKMLEAASLLKDTRSQALTRLMGGTIEHILNDSPRHSPDTLLHQGVEAVRRMGDADMLANASYFFGVLHYLQGNLALSLRAFDRARNQQDAWRYNYFTAMSITYTGPGAAFLGRYPQAVGELESARRTLELEGSQPVAMWQRTILTSILLYCGLDNEALEMLDPVLHCVSAESDAKCNLWAWRNLAYYHYRVGNIKASQRIFERVLRESYTRGYLRLSFSAPWLLEMLCEYKRHGLPPLPGFNPDEELRQALESSNIHLRGMALRQAAFEAWETDISVSGVAELLRESVEAFEAAGNPLETARSQVYYAKALEKCGETGRATQLRKVAEETLAGYGVPGYRRVEVPSAGTWQGLTLRSSEGRSLRNCLLELEKTVGDESFPAALERITRIAQRELGAEFAALFRPSGDEAIEPAALVNLSAVELGSNDMAECLRQAALYVKKAESGRLVTGSRCMIFLSLQATTRSHWILCLGSKYTAGDFIQLAESEQNAVIQTFSQELRVILRLEAMRSDAERRQEPVEAVTGAEDQEMGWYAGSALQPLLGQIRQVAETDATVLVLGETGVGKELLARHIHDMSKRTGPFIAVHPAATTETLFESEFFGHEKGSFTGAARQKTGLFELAHKGTIFIDEVGDVPLSMQTKLLRVIQERRFMRVGGVREIHSDFRLIAATNHNLWEAVQAGQFREDLYYRLSVVPLLLPPLRARQEDIPVLVKLFLDHFAQRYNRMVPAPTPAALAVMQEYPWPGNVRELRSVVERAVILHAGGDIGFAPGLHQGKAEEETRGSGALFTDLPTMQELQQRYIRHILALTGGRVSGPGGASEILDLKRSTLYAKIQQYGIKNVKGA